MLSLRPARAAHEYSLPSIIPVGAVLFRVLLAGTGMTPRWAKATEHRFPEVNADGHRGQRVRVARRATQPRAGASQSARLTAPRLSGRRSCYDVDVRRRHWERPLRRSGPAAVLQPLAGASSERRMKRFSAV